MILRALVSWVVVSVFASPALAERAPSPKVSKDKVASYRKHLAAGRKLGDQKKWGEAVVEFKAALADIPDDGRALSELGWAAFAAGDYPTARKANLQAVQVAGDLKVKAASLYNLGRVEEATGDKAAAARDYAMSLIYRPGNKIVTDALAKVQAKLPKAPSAAPADAGGGLDCDVRGTKAICDCFIKASNTELADYVRDEPDQGATCDTDEEGKVPAPFSVIRVYEPGVHQQHRYLLIKEGGAERQVGTLAQIETPSSMGLHENASITSATVKTIGGHKVLFLHEELDHTDNDRSINETEETTEDDLTLCVLGDEKTHAPTTCPLSVAVSSQYERRIMIEDDPDDTEKHKGLPKNESYTLDVKVDDSGVATVTLTKGAADDRARAELGPHKLW